MRNCLPEKAYMNPYTMPVNGTPLRERKKATKV